MEVIKKNKNKGPKSLQKNRNSSKIKSDKPSLTNAKDKNIGNLENIINQKYLSNDFKNQFSKCWREEGPPIQVQELQSLSVLNTPFNCAFLPNMFEEEDLLRKVESELQQIELCNKNNDLFKFKCTGNLKLTEKTNIQKLCQIIQGPLKNWVQDVSGVSLTSKVSISSSMYKYSDILLCHDDELEGRRIAFILYLVPEWKQEFGGSLDLLSVDSYGRPHLIEKRLFPEFNSFAFFEVSPVSYHQVSEVLVQNVKRVTINGWFYGKPVAYPPRYILKPPVYIPPGYVEEHILYAWINPMYLDQNTQIEIRKEFQEKSEIQISDFLKSRKYDELSAALRSQSLKWKWAGPPYKRHLEVVSRRDVPDVVKDYLLVMQSEAMFLILSQLTGLSLHRLAPEDSDTSDADDCGNNSDPECSKSVDNQRNEKIDRGTFCSKGFSSSDEEEDIPKQKKTFNVSKMPLVSQNNKRKRTGKKLTKKQKIEGSSPSVSQNYSTISEDWESDVEREALTEIKLNSDIGDSKGEMTCEVRRWRWGSYSLMRDDDLVNVKDFILDAMFFCNGSKDWKIKYGGGTVYVAKGEQEQLLTVLPVPNSLALVYRDSQTYKFMKHINVKSTELSKNESVFHEIVSEYREREKIV